MYGNPDFLSAHLQNDLRIYHQCSRHTNSLLLSSGHLIWQMLLMLFQLDQIQHLIRFFRRSAFGTPRKLKGSATFSNAFILPKS